MFDVEPNRDLTALPDAQLEDDFEQLQRAAQSIEVERLRLLAEITRRRLFERDGYLSAAGWLVATHRIGWSEAGSNVRMSRDLEQMPATRQALEKGTVTMAAARVLASAHRANPEEFEQSEGILVEAAASLSVRDLQRAVAYWREAADARTAREEPEERWSRRGLHASTTLDGMVRVDGNLDPETGRTLLTALRGVLDAEARSKDWEDRTPAQRRADALGEICRQWLDRSDRPAVAGERPHVSLTVDLSRLKGGSDGSSEFDGTGVVSAAIVRRWACDASVSRIMFGGRSEPLDVGRRTPIVPPPMRRAVVVRDRHCRFPGCDRPQSWCDAHHVQHWADGGSTALSNLVLLCRRHHRLVHQRFRVEIIDRQPVFTRPDGSNLADRAPP